MSAFGVLKQLEAGVLSVGYAEAGPTDREAVLLLHGWPYDIHSYVDVAPLLAQAGYHVIVFSLRGFGSTRFRSSQTFRNGEQLALALMLVFGAYVFVDGIFAVVTGIGLRRQLSLWWLVVLEGVAGIVLGVLTFRPRHPPTRSNGPALRRPATVLVGASRSTGSRTAGWRFNWCHQHPYHASCALSSGVRERLPMTQPLCEQLRASLIIAPVEDAEILGIGAPENTRRAHIHFCACVRSGCPVPRRAIGRLHPYLACPYQLRRVRVHRPFALPIVEDTRRLLALFHRFAPVPG